jgi:hypothetical protein
MGCPGQCKAGSQHWPAARCATDVDQIFQPPPLSRPLQGGRQVNSADVGAVDDDVKMAIRNVLYWAL